jgi:5-methylcytosine-specific restriction endonuclease McrA
VTGHVLLLNADYSAMSVTSVRRALVLVLHRKADVVEALPGEVLRSAMAFHPWPSIVRLRQYVRVPYRQIMLTRKNVLRRDRFRCQYCGARDHLTIDHVLPRSRGGKDTWDNLVTACTGCNARKGCRTPEEAHMPLHRKPHRPSHVMFIRDYVGTLDDTWKPYLFLS